MRPIFIASIGNPGSEYAHTLHSAGHTLLAALVAHAGLPPLAISRNTTGTRGRCSYADAQRLAFWESPAYMNESGPQLHTAWRKWCASAAAAATSTSSSLERSATGMTSPDATAHTPLLPRLIILHDELELPIGRFAVKTGTGQSARGHNGLKSVLAAPGMHAVRFTRVGVGIGPRPESREPADVARFVLWKMTRVQRVAVEGLTGAVWREVERIREGGDEVSKPSSKPKGPKGPGKGGERGQVQGRGRGSGAGVEDTAAIMMAPDDE